MAVVLWTVHGTDEAVQALYNCTIVPVRIS
jgi:hypothetical protein